MWGYLIGRKGKDADKEFHLHCSAKTKSEKDRSMNSSIASPKIVVPKLTDEEKEGLRNYWQIYEAHRQDVAAALLRMAGDLPEFKFILQNSSQQPSAEQQQANMERQRRAIYQ